MTRRTLALALVATASLTACELTNPLVKPEPPKASADEPTSEPAKAAGAKKLGAAMAPAAPALKKLVAKTPPNIASGETLSAGQITDIKPDGEDTASKPPTADDLKRYTADLGNKGTLTATIKTTMGDFQCELYEDVAPVTVANFVGLARGLKAWTDPKTRKPQVGTPLYQNLIFHRVIPKFMIQGGDPLGVGRGGPGYRIPDEFSPKHKHSEPGILSMANSGPNTGGSQFFVTEVATPWLDGKHTVFGKCAEGDLVKKIANVPAKASKPNEDVFIRQINISRR